jgi:hypothetical protein
MTPEEFRRIALSLPEAKEVYRRGRTHFRVERKAFATLEGPGDTVATVNLTPDQQSMFMHEAPKVSLSALSLRGPAGTFSEHIRSAGPALLATVSGAPFAARDPEVCRGTVGAPSR